MPHWQQHQRNPNFLSRLASFRVFAGGNGKTISDGERNREKRPMIIRKISLLFMGLALVIGLGVEAAMAQYPEKPIT
ncbi:MAG TPA: hypothetical protein VLA28_01485, partial [Afifellaceae bacterium]|nr:hypothetical protein [Afifellaceae bacterium]